MARQVRYFFIPMLGLGLLFPVIYAQVRLTPFEDKGRFGFRNESGAVVIPPRYIMANEFSGEGIAAVIDESGWAYINREGKILIRPYVVDNGPDYFAEGLARFKENDKVGFFDKRGKIIIRAQFDFAAPFHEGLAAICRGCRRKSEGEHETFAGGNWGYINKKGTVAIPLGFDSAESFESGRAKVSVKGVAQTIDKKGTPVTTGRRN